MEEFFEEENLDGLRVAFYDTKAVNPNQVYLVGFVCSEPVPSNLIEFSEFITITDDNNVTHNLVRGSGDAWVILVEGLCGELCVWDKSPRIFHDVIR